MRVAIIAIELALLIFLFIMKPRPSPIVPTLPTRTETAEDIKLREHAALVPFDDRIENRSILWKYR